MKYRLAALFLLLPCLTFAQTADEKKATIGYLRSLQKEGGLRPSAKAAAPTLQATSSGLRALGYFGGSAKDVEGAKKFVLACHDEKTGGFADAPGGKPDVAATAVGLMALVTLKIPTEKYEKAAIAYMADNAKQFEQIRMTAAGLEAVGKTCDKNKEWLADLTAKRNADGTYGKDARRVFDTGSVVPCVLRLGGKVGDASAILEALDAGQLPDGGFGGEKESDLAASYRVMRTYHMLKAKPKRADDLRAFVAKCRNADGGYGVAPGAPSSIGGAYFAGVILHWLGEK